MADPICYLNPNQNPIPVPNVSSSGSGAMTPALLAQLESAITEGAVDIYVDSVNGNDSNPGTLALPLATFDAAVALSPTSWTASCTIHCATGTYAFDGNNYFFGTPHGKSAAPILVLGTEIDQLGTLTETTGTTTTSYVAAVVTTNGQFLGASLRNVRTGLQARIINSTYSAPNTTFTLETALTFNAGDTFVVTLPGVVFNTPQTGPAGINNAYIGFKNVRFAHASTSGAPFLLLVDNAIVDMYNCEVDCGSAAGGILVATGSRLVGSGQSGNWGNLSVNPVSDTAAGLYFHSSSASAGGQIQAFLGAQVIGNFLLSNTYMTLTQSYANLTVLNGTNASIAAYENSVLEYNEGALSGSHNSIVDSVLIEDGSFGEFLISRDGSVSLGLSIANSQANAINVQNARARIGAVSGTGNTTYGITSFMSQVQRVGSPTVTGTTNDTLVGTTAKAYGALPFAEAATLSTIQ